MEFCWNSGHSGISSNFSCSLITVTSRLMWQWRLLWVGFRTKVGVMCHKMRLLHRNIHSNGWNYCSNSKKYCLLHFRGSNQNRNLQPIQWEHVHIQYLFDHHFLVHRLCNKIINYKTSLHHTLYSRETIYLQLKEMMQKYQHTPLWCLMH